MMTVVDKDTGEVLDRRGRANLYLAEKDRLYTFEWTARWAGVRKFVGDRKVEDRTLSVAQARRLWSWLIRLGYRRV